jgi:hypothetical protein
MPHVSQRRSEFTGSYTPHVQALPRSRGARFWVETVLLIALVSGMGIRAYMTAAAHNARVGASTAYE